MSTIEKLFVQIFERRDRIIDQLKLQKQLLDQRLASKLLINGINPPPWLLYSSNFPLPSSTSADLEGNCASSVQFLSGLNKEELISGLLLPHPRLVIPHSNGECSWYSKQVLTESNVELPDTHAETSAHMEWAHGKCSEVQSQKQLTGAEHELSHAAATPQDQAVERIVDNYSESGSSLARVQRSRSRQKALELRNSAKTGAKNRLGNENNPGVCSSDSAHRQANNCNEFLKFTKPSPFVIECDGNKVAIEDFSMEKITDGCSSAIIPRSGCQDFKGETEVHVNTDTTTAYSRRIVSSNSPLQGSIVPGCELPEKGDQSLGVMIMGPQITESEQVEKECFKSTEQIDAFSSGNIMYGGRITRSRTSAAKQAEIQCDRKIEEVEDINSKQTTGSSKHCPQSVATDHHKYTKIDDGCSGGITRSTSHEGKEDEGGDPRSQEMKKKSDATPAGNLSFQRHGGQLEAEPAVVASLEGNVQASFPCGDCKVGTDLQVTEVDVASCRKGDGFERTSLIEFTPAISGNETEVGPSTAQNAELFHCHLSTDTHVASYSKPTEANLVEKFMATTCSLKSDLGFSWPQLKRRKVESELLSFKSAGTSLKVDQLEEISDIQSMSKCIFKHHSVCLPVHFSMPHNLDVAVSSVSCVSDAEVHKNMTCSVGKCSPHLLEEKGELSIGRCSAIGSLMLNNGLLEQSVASCFTALAAETKGSFAEEGKVNVAGDLLREGQCDILSHIDNRPISTLSEDLLRSAKLTLDKRKPLPEEDDVDASVVSRQMESTDVVGSDYSITDGEKDITNFAGDSVSFEEFNFSGSTIERASFLEQLCRSATLNTPLSHFASEYISHRLPSIDQSLPNGLWEQIDLRSGLPLDDSSEQLVRTHYSDGLSLPSGRLGWDSRIPYLSPICKSYKGISSKSGSSDKLGSSNPELTCFPIEEDTESIDEYIKKNDVADAYPEGSSKAGSTSVRREPFCDITAENINQDSDIAAEKSGSECTSAETTAGEMPSRSIQKNGNCHSRSRHKNLRKDNQSHSLGANSIKKNATALKSRLKNGNCHNRSRHENLRKDNQSHSLGANSIKKNATALKSRLKNSKLSVNTSQRSQGKNFAENEYKCSNIVSNVKSFLPLVQQKRAAALESGNLSLGSC
ncbi:hypothetical protein Dimus_019227 [Dionaea muscipula]